MSALVLPERREDRLALLALLKEKERRESRRKLWTYFPDTGPLRRELYQQHLEFFRLGATVPTRAFMAAAHAIGELQPRDRMRGLWQQQYLHAVGQPAFGNASQAAHGAHAGQWGMELEHGSAA